MKKISVTIRECTHAASIYGAMEITICNLPKEVQDFLNAQKVESMWENGHFSSIVEKTPVVMELMKLVTAKDPHPSVLCYALGLLDIFWD